MFLFSVAGCLCKKLPQSVSFGNCIERIRTRVSENSEKNNAATTKSSRSLEITFEKVGWEWIQVWFSVEFNSIVVFKTETRRSRIFQPFWQFHEGMYLFKLVEYFYYDLRLNNIFCVFRITWVPHSWKTLMQWRLSRKLTT